MSGMLPADDQDFSFTLPFSEESDWLSSTKKNPVSRGVLVAVMASLVVHAIIFQWEIPQYTYELRADSAKPIHIKLDYAVQSAPSPIEFENDPIAKILPDPVTETISDPKPEVVDDIAVSEVLPQHMIEQDLETIVLQQNRYRDDYLPSPNAEPTVAPQTHSPEAQHFNNVFDPRLRARLQNNPVRRASQQASGPTTVANIHGNIIVEQEGGGCMMAVSAAVTQPTNWYLTTCAGKSESEQMMERINNEVKSRR
jgi:hypothetical protein